MLTILSLIILFIPILSFDCYSGEDIEHDSGGGGRGCHGHRHTGRRLLMNPSSSEDNNDDEGQIETCSTSCMVTENDNGDLDKGCDVTNLCLSLPDNTCGTIFNQITFETIDICCCNTDLCNTNHLFDDYFESTEVSYFGILIFEIFGAILFHFIMSSLLYLIFKKVSKVKNNITPITAFIPFYNLYIWITKVAELDGGWFIASIIGYFCGCYICIEPYISIKAGKRFGKSICWSLSCLFCCKMCGLCILACDKDTKYTSKNNDNNQQQQQGNVQRIQVIDLRPNGNGNGGNSIGIGYKEGTNETQMPQPIQVQQIQFIGENQNQNQNQNQQQQIPEAFSYGNANMNQFIYPQLPQQQPQQQQQQGMIPIYVPGVGMNGETEDQDDNDGMPLMTHI